MERFPYGLLPLTSEEVLEHYGVTPSKGNEARTVRALARANQWHIELVAKRLWVMDKEYRKWVYANERA